MKKKFKKFDGDFETTVYEGQEYTEVWASAIVPLKEPRSEVEYGEEDVRIFGSIDETFRYLISLNQNVIVYYHNLKFDGYFWIDYLLIQRGFVQAAKAKGEERYDLEFMNDKEMPNNTFKYLISDMGQWYNITVKIHGKLIVFRDSLKLLPFSVRHIGDGFKTYHRKLDMEYKGFRYAGCEITPEERHYIANDVLVVKEALEIMFEEGHDKMTIGSCCLAEYKRTLSTEQWKLYFPDLRFVQLDENVFGAPDAERYVRNSYKGGWCYLARGKEGKHFNGCTADVNSLYPSMMHSESGNKYPVGLPVFWQGDQIPEEALSEKRYYFIRFRTRFKIKPGMLPTVQIKGSFMYRGTEWLETSDIRNPKTGNYNRYYINLNGEKTDSRVTLTMTMTDYILFREHYDVFDFEILDGCYFRAITGLFDDYIDKYRKIKMESKGARRTLAKLFLNNLYGKLATSPNKDYKVAFVEDSVVHFADVLCTTGKPMYIPAGSAITSYARNFTIRAAQANYYGPDEPGFIYADTDSIHCDLSVTALKNVPIHDTAFCHWKIETEWDVAFFQRQKTYIEHTAGAELDDPDSYDIKCAGMPDNCKGLFAWSMTGRKPSGLDKELDELPEDQQEFVKERRSLEDFTVGLAVPGKLMPRRIPGGIILVDTMFEMR